MTSPGNFRPTKKLPAPYKRPSISIGGGVQKKREWKFVTALDVREGDIIADLGLVHEINYIRLQDPVQIYVSILAGEHKTPIKFEAGETLQAFA